MIFLIHIFFDQEIVVFWIGFPLILHPSGDGDDGDGGGDDGGDGDDDGDDDGEDDDGEDDDGDGDDGDDGDEDDDGLMVTMLRYYRLLCYNFNPWEDLIKVPPGHPSGQFQETKSSDLLATGAGTGRKPDRFCDQGQLLLDC